MNKSNVPGLLLAVHPTSHGFGWAFFEGPLVPVDWGIASAKVNRSAQSMARFKQLLDQYQPAALVLEKFGKGDSKRSERIRSLAQTMRGFANNRDMDTLVYSRAEVSAAVTTSTKASRHTVALAVVKQLPFLCHRLPKSRKLWTSEDDRQCLFDAVALGITHYSITRPQS